MNSQDCPHKCKCIQLQPRGLRVVCRSKELRSVPSPIPVDTTELDLSFNNIQVLFRLYFRNCSNLSWLDLSWNDIEDADEDAFNSLVNLKFLSLSNNRLWYNYYDFPQNLFKPLINLKSLNIHANNKEYVVCFMFLHLLNLIPSHIETLHLDGPMDDCFSGFERFSNLTELGIYRLTLNILTNYSLKPLSSLNIKKFRCQFYNSEHIEQSAFNWLTNLSELDLGNSTFYGDFNLVNLSSSWVGLNSTKLSVLRLTAINYLTPVCLEPIFFRNLGQLENLKELYMDGLDIADCYKYDSIFSENRQLEFLTLAFGSVKYYRLDGVFSKNINLRNLDLSFLKEPAKTMWSRFRFKLSPKLNILNMSGSISVTKGEIIKITLDGENELRLFKFGDNSIEVLSEFGMSNPNIHIPLRLDFSRNKLVTVAGDFFKQSVDQGVIFDGLYLSDNSLGEQLRYMNGIFFKDLANLTVLDLSFNSIKTLPELIFINQSEMQILNLSKNSLHSVNFKFSHMVNLSHLDLSENLMALLDLNTQNTINRLKSNNLSVNLFGNPLQCSCDMLSFLEWMDQSRHIFLKFESYSCTYRASIANFSQFDKIFEELNFECSLQFLLRMSVALMITLVLIITVAIALYRYRWEVKFLCLKFVVEKSHYQTLIDAENEYEFDAFVAYHKDNGDWVRDELFENLDVKNNQTQCQEDHRRFKLCIHERDFIPGTPIEENIAHAIENSRKTILVLSKSFLESGWCEFELQMACMENIDKGRNAIIVVMLEDLPAKKMSKSLRLLIRKNTYIEWSNDEDLKKNFWEKMRVALGSVNFRNEILAE